MIYQQNCKVKWRNDTNQTTIELIVLITKQAPSHSSHIANSFIYSSLPSYCQNQCIYKENSKRKTNSVHTKFSAYLNVPHLQVFQSLTVIKCAIDMSSEQAKPSVQAFGRKV